MPKHIAPANRPPSHLTIPVIYAAVATAYIVASSYLLGELFTFGNQIARFEILKGLGFVIVTSLGLWFILYRRYRSRLLGEATYRELVQNLGDAVLVLQMPARTILYANPAAEKMFGYPARELFGRPAGMLHVDDEHERIFTDNVGEVPAAGGAYRGNFVLRRKNGETFPTQHLLSRFRDRHGNEYALSIVRDTTSIERYEDAIRESEERLRQITENLREVIWVSDPEKSRMEYVSPAYEKVWGRPVESLYENAREFIEAVHPEDRPWVEARVMNQAHDEYDVQYRIVRPDGTVRWIWDRASPIRNDRGEVHRIIGIAEDITEFRKREADLLQAQKLEAIGRLTGGVAHDFNNLLMVILGQAEALADSMPDDPARRGQVESILQAGQRAADMTRRLLTFARHQPLRTDRIDFRNLIDEVVALLRPTIGGSVAIETDVAPDFWPIAADTAQLETSLINLAINARDAMPQGGVVTIRAANESIDTARARAMTGIEPGDYVRIEVSDTGVGMEPETATRVFEPFFTTKEAGKGTGLGLAMTYGFVTQSGGHIDIESKPGEGTTFRIYLRRHVGAIDSAPAQFDVTSRGNEAVLVVENDPTVRTLAVAQLRGLGYQVIEAERGHDALALLQQRPDIELLLSDVMIPGGMSGAQLAAAARQLRPEVKILLISGSGEQEVLEHSGLMLDTPLLRKPYRRAELAAAVRRALDASLAA
ncbi:MAG: PAS domain S-box protein [Rhodospirillaceae bacterium]|nr:PAS domain S-box protein [Rhodospirillaceae bacterium]